jgi:putative FmdB family regulatory protein
MPLYEYLCEKCGHKFERIQKFSDPLVETCPKCGSHVHKLASSPAIQFKGSGWYITDYAKKDSVPSSEAKGDSKNDGKAEAKSDAKSESKADSKSSDSAPAAKPDAKPSTS